METKELKITIPEGQEIDWQESAKQEKIVFKKKENTKPRSWEEYCKNNEDNQVWFIEADSNISECDFLDRCDEYKNTIPSKELAEAFLAMMQLMSLRQAWIGDWKPDWENNFIGNWCVISQEYKLKVDFFCTVAKVLSFPTKEMAEDFMNCFKDLLEIAKPLI